MSITTQLALDEHASEFFTQSRVGSCLPIIAMAGRIIGTAATSLHVVVWLLLSIGGGLLMARFLQ